jgi:predicted DNA-binding ribbon-helix-helix protein
MEKIDFLTQTVETDVYELPLDFYLECEEIASKLELTVDYLIDEFFVDGELQLQNLT